MKGRPVVTGCPEPCSMDGPEAGLRVSEGALPAETRAEAHLHARPTGVFPASGHGGAFATGTDARTGDGGRCHGLEPLAGAGGEEVGSAASQ